ncbi:hypothetical protein [Actinocorallia longicatena]|uniref:Uncharacterized protein n=1 Tax=Actinocorallia longicatena TaxID=111803 RepID=A0ABP6QMC4_9ACTN
MSQMAVPADYPYPRVAALRLPRPSTSPTAPDPSRTAPVPPAPPRVGVRAVLLPRLASLRLPASWRRR